MADVAISFDTHRFVKRLTEHGFTQEQAEVLAEEQVNLLNGNLATKHDIRELSRDIKELSVKMENDNKELSLKMENDNKKLSLKMESDLKELSVKVDRDLKELSLKTGNDIKSAEIRLLRWMATGFISLAGLTVALISFFGYWLQG